jgi:drug/metabolite transporter (DMT)-like permease
MQQKDEGDPRNRPGLHAVEFCGDSGQEVPWNAFPSWAFRSLIAVILVGISRRSFRPKLTKGTWIGACAVLATATLFIFANRLTSAANAIVLQYASPSS